MNKTKAQELARSLMDKHGLNHLDFEFDRSKRRLGACHFQKIVFGGHVVVKTLKITLSTHYVEILPENEIRETILHEIAHALAGPQNGHNARWKATARSLGIKGDRCATPSAVPESSVKGKCPNCGFEYAAHRLPLRMKMCGQCRHIPKGQRVLEWHKSGKVVVLANMPARYRQEMTLAKAKGLL